MKRCHTSPKRLAATAGAFSDEKLTLLIQMTDAAVDAMAAALTARLVDVRPNLEIQPVSPDGHCQYRAVSMQCRTYGSQGHERLREHAIRHVEAHKEYFLPFFANSRNFNYWITSARNGAWGDNISLAAMCRTLQRPVAVWRRGSAQVPTVLVPEGYDADHPADPIYLELDEHVRKNEHYVALRLGRRGPEAHERELVQLALMEIS